MKVFFKYVMAALAFSAMVLSSCTKEEAPKEEKSNDVSIKGIVAFCPSADREVDELTASMQSSTHTITLTTAAVYSNETPVDLTNVKIQLTLAKGATSDLKDSYDLSEGKTDKLVITAEDGETKAEWSLEAVRVDDMIVIPTSVKATATPVWTKNAVELGVKNPLWGSRGMDCYREGGNDYLYILDNTLAPSDDNRIRIHNAKDGNFIDDVKEYEGGAKGCRSYMWGLDCDDAGHIAITRLNADQAGFWLDLYDNAANGWAYLGSPLKYAQSQEGLTYYAGKKVQVIGNLLEGQGSVLATYGHFYGRLAIQGGYDVFSFTDGAPAPAIINYPYPTEWWAGEVQQESISDPTIYVTIVDEFSYGNDPEETWPELHASHFEINDPVQGTTIAVSDECFNYRILASEVFNCGSGKYLYTLEQTYTCTGPYVERLYYISNPELLKVVTPLSEDYNKFLIWESEYDDIEGDSNDYRFGSVCVLPDENSNSAVLFAYHASSDSERAKICATRVTFEESFE